MATVPVAETVVGSNKSNNNPAIALTMIIRIYLLTMLDFFILQSVYDLLI